MNLNQSFVSQMSRLTTQAVFSYSGWKLFLVLFLALFLFRVPFAVYNYYYHCTTDGFFNEYNGYFLTIHFVSWNVFFLRIFVFCTFVWCSDKHIDIVGLCDAVLTNQSSMHINCSISFPSFRLAILVSRQ